MASSLAQMVIVNPLLSARSTSQNAVTMPCCCATLGLTA
jgi:hypothetical protein